MDETRVRDGSGYAKRRVCLRFGVVSCASRVVRATDGSVCFVLRSLRSTLRTVLSWCVDRNIFYEERDRIRRSFEANAALKDLGEIEKAVSDGEKTLESYAHPDPYVIPTMYGGSKYARNPETPAGTGMVFDFGREPHTIPK